MTQLVKILNVNVIFLHCDIRMAAQPQFIKLIDSRIVRLDKLQDMVVENRFDNPLQKQYVYMRHTWYMQKMMECMQSNFVGFVCVHHWAIQSGNRSTFMFDGKLFPDVAYIFDQNSEHWFCGRVDGRSNQLITKELSRKLARSPPIKEILDSFQSQLSQCRLASYTADKTEIAILRPFETLQIVEQLPLSSAMLPIERKSPTPPKHTFNSRRRKRHFERMNNGKFLADNRNNKSHESDRLEMVQNHRDIKNFLMERMNNLNRPGTSAEAVRQDELNLREEVQQTRLSERKLSEMTRQARRSRRISPHLLQQSEARPEMSPEIALQDAFQEKTSDNSQQKLFQNPDPYAEARNEKNFYKRLYIKWTSCNDNVENFRK